MNPLRSGLLAAAAIAALPAAAQTEPEAAPEHAVSIGGRYVVDLIDLVDGGDERGGRVLGNVELTADGDLDRIAGWRGGHVRLHVLSNHGGAINDLAGTLQGVDNIEVSEGRTKLYEAWIEQTLPGGRASLLVGLADLNAEFYQNDSAGTLIAPPFGIGSELAATGPNGPSIFPSTALTARLNVSLGKRGYVRVAAVNARAGVLGDVPGVDFSMRDGLLFIVEGGRLAGGKLALGAWRYSRRQDDIVAVDPGGNPVRRIASGAYVLIDQRVAGNERRGANLFMRLGVSEGRTTPFRGGGQAGILLHGLVPGRPESAVSLGVHYGALSRGYRDSLRGAGADPLGGEIGIELTYQDQVSRFLSVQPDLQYVRRADPGASGQRGALLLGLRLTASFGPD